MKQYTPEKDFCPEKSETCLGEGVKGLSPTNIVRLKKCWEDEYQNWTKRNLSDKHYVYLWVDGIYFQVRLDEERSCILLIMGADAEGKKELIALSDGYRESKIAWREMLLDLKKRGLQEMPKLAIGDGGLGLWAALLGAYSYHQSNRVNLCHGTVKNQTDQRRWISERNLKYRLQTSPGGRKELAEASGI